MSRLAEAQKPGAGIPAYTRWVNRPAGRVLAACAFALRLTPNQVTLLSGLVSGLGIATLAFGPLQWPSTTLAAALLLLGYALDSADGQLARLSGVSSKAGEWLDHVVDACRMPAFHTAIAIAVFRSGDVSDGWVLLPLGFALLVTTWFFSQILASQLVGKHDTSPASDARPWVSFLKLSADPGTLYISTLILPWPPAFLIVYGTLFVISSAQAALSLVRRYRDLSASGVADDDEYVQRGGHGPS